MTDLHAKYNLDRVVNAAGSFTPLGVSRSPAAVSQAVSAALGEYFIVDQLQSVASDAIASYCGAEAAAVTHCAAAGLTIGIAGLLVGGADDAVRALPDIGDRRRKVVLPATHSVNYGHEITQAIRLCGATPTLAGERTRCTLDDIDQALDTEDVGCLMLVSSRLIHNQSLDLEAATRLARARGIPVLIDGAAQDMRMEALVQTGAELVVFSAHKYLAAPTAGLVVGQTRAVADARAHERGIGRAMKATKEAIIGVLAAVEERGRLNLQDWLRAQSSKVGDFVTVANRIDGVVAESQPDPAGMPIQRIVLTIDPMVFGSDARLLNAALNQSDPPVYVMTHELAEGRLVLEIQSLERHEIATILESIRNAGGQ